MLGKKKVSVWRLAQKWNFSLNTANPRCSAPWIQPLDDFTKPTHQTPRLWFVLLFAFCTLKALWLSIGSQKLPSTISPLLLSRNGVVKLSEGLSSPQPDDGLAFGMWILFCAVYFPLHHGGDTSTAVVPVLLPHPGSQWDIQILPRRVLSAGSWLPKQPFWAALWDSCRGQGLLGSLEMAQSALRLQLR